MTDILIFYYSTRQIIFFSLFQRLNQCWFNVDCDAKNSVDAVDSCGGRKHLRSEQGCQSWGGHATHRQILAQNIQKFCPFAYTALLCSYCLVSNAYFDLRIVSQGSLCLVRGVSYSNDFPSFHITNFRLYSQENNLLNDYSAKMALGLFGKTWWRFSSYSIVYRGR